MDGYQSHQQWHFDHNAPLDQIERPILVVTVWTPLSWFGYNRYGCRVLVGPEN